MQRVILALLIVVTVFQTSTASAQDSGCGVTGKITNASGNRLEFVTITIRTTADSIPLRTVLSDSTGSFSLNNIPSGNYILSATLIGYVKLSQPFAIGAPCVQPLDLGAVVMQEKAGTLTQVTVVGRRPLIQRRLDKTVLNIENSTLASGSTAFEILQLAPGVTVSNNDNIQLFGKGSPLIMIDGKPTYLSVEQVVNLLKNMPSNNIAEIEIISQPSAKYDAAGNSGIINIKMKQNKAKGFTGNTSLSLGYGRREKERGSLNMAYKGSKFNVTADYAFNINHSIRYLDINRLLYNTGSKPTEFNRAGRIDNRLGGHNYKTTFTYLINKNHSVGAQLLGYNNKQKQYSTAFTDIRQTGGDRDSFLTSSTEEISTFRSIGGNVNYFGKLDSLGTTLTFDADYAKFNTRINRLFGNSLFDKGGTLKGGPDEVRNYFPTLIDVKVAKTDLTMPLRKKAKLEAGLKTSYVTTDNDAQFDSLINNNWVPSLSQTNHFIYKENVNAAYVNYRKEFEKTSIQGGVRLENTNSDGYSITLDSRTRRHYTDLFPSFFISRELKANSSLMFSYSRRIQRPSYQDLNPFRFFGDRYTYSEGNPFLRPAYTHSLELSTSIREAVTVMVRYAVTRNVIAEDVQQNEENGIITVKSYLRNLKALRSFTVSMSYSRDLTPWWSTDNGITLNHSEYADDNLGNLRNLDNFNFGINMFNAFQISKTWTAELSGFYRSPWLYGFIEADAQYKIDAGVRKNFGSKASLRFRITDIFNTNRFRGTAKYDNVDVLILNRFETRTAFVTFSYIFGNNKLKVSRRSEGTKDEQQRIKTENN